MHGSLADFALMWAGMCAAMMAPTAARPMLRIARGRASRAAAFMAGYLAVWVALAVPAWPLVDGVRWPATALFAAWVIVGAYQLLPSTARLMRACRTLRADGAPAISGLRYGIACAAACGPLMVVAMATLHAIGAPLAVSVAAMAAVTAFVMWEKAQRVPLARVRMSGAAIVAIAALAFVVVPPGSGHGAHAVDGASSRS